MSTRSVANRTFIQSPHFGPAHEALRADIREFLGQQVVPKVPVWEEQRRIPKDIWTEMGARGWLGLSHRGPDSDIFESVVFLEELGRTGLAGFRGAISVHSYMATAYLHRAGSPELRERYLAPAGLGTMRAGLAISEADAGSALTGIRCRAERRGDRYVINGEKRFVTNGFHGEFFVLVARTGGEETAHTLRGLTLFVVENGTPGVATRRVEKMGWHCSDTAHISLQDVELSSDQVVGRPGWGFQYLMQCLQLERLAAALVAIGGIDHCLELARTLFDQRMIGDVPLKQFQAVRHRMADLATDAEAARHLVYHAAWLYGQGTLPVLECSMAKLKATEVANQIAHACLQLHGGEGYMEESPVSRVYRDTCLATIVGGASEVQRDIIAQSVVDGIDLRQ